jgi:hypothetical protein
MTKAKEQVSSLICPLPAPHTCLLVPPSQLRPQEDQPKGGGEEAVSQLSSILLWTPSSLGGPRTKTFRRLMTQNTYRPLPERLESQNLGTGAVSWGGATGAARAGFAGAGLEVPGGPGERTHWRCGIPPRRTLRENRGGGPEAWICLCIQGFNERCALGTRSRC